MLAAAITATAILLLLVIYLAGRLALYWLARAAFGRADNW